MSKKVLCLLLTVIIASSLIISSVSVAFGEEIETLPSTEPPSGIAAEDPSASYENQMLPAETRPVSKANHPVLTVIAISNFFGRTDAYYDEYTDEVVVTYYLRSMKRLQDTQWEIRYDSSVLTFDPEKNTAATVCPLMSDSCCIQSDTENDRILFEASSLRLFDFSDKQAVFAQIVFDVKALSPSDAEITKIDLTINELYVSEPNPVTGFALGSKTSALVSSSKVDNSKASDKSLLTKSSRLTPSTFREPDSPATADQVVTTAPATKPAPTVKKEPEKKPKEEPKEEGFELINTGKWYIAALILGVLFVCSAILFVMRKRDIYND